jgi:DNA-binding LacI/PurR family transcriptional regulator
MANLAPGMNSATSGKLLANRKTIGFMISIELENNFHVPIWKGVSEVAQEKNTNLVTFLNSNVWYAIDTIRKNETIYKQINTSTLDGMISFDFGVPWVIEKLTHFESAANVIINYPRPNYPCLTISQKEIKLAVDHLIKRRSFISAVRKEISRQNQGLKPSSNR